MLSDDELRALQEDAHMLEELTRHAGWQVFVGYCHAIMDGDKRRVLAGAVSDPLEYRAVTGRLVGIHDALNAPAVARQKVDTELGQRRERAEVE